MHAMTLDAASSKAIEVSVSILPVALRAIAGSVSAPIPIRVPTYVHCGDPAVTALKTRLRGNAKHLPCRDVVMEEAQAYRQLVDDFGLTQEQIATRVGKSRAAVANTLRLLGASEEVKRALLVGDIREGHARALLTVEHEEAQEAALAVVLKQGLNVRQTEELVRRLAGEREERPMTPPPSPELLALENTIRETLGTKVSLQQNRTGSGRSPA